MVKTRHESYGREVHTYHSIHLLKKDMWIGDGVDNCKAGSSLQEYQTTPLLSLNAQEKGEMVLLTVKVGGIRPLNCMSKHRRQSRREVKLEMAQRLRVAMLISDQALMVYS
jgi:hypothetical protein